MNDVAQIAPARAFTFNLTIPAADVSDDIATADDRAVLDRLLISGCKIDHGNKDFAALHGRFNIPDQAGLEAGNLGTSERDADAELKPLGLSNTGFKQPACLSTGIAEAAQLGLAGGDAL